MQFFKADIDDGVIYVTKNPQTWMKVSKEKAIEIESFLAASDPILIRSLKKNFENIPSWRERSI